MRPKQEWVDAKREKPSAVGYFWVIIGRGKVKHATWNGPEVGWSLKGVLHWLKKYKKGEK